MPPHVPQPTTRPSNAFQESDRVVQIGEHRWEPHTLDGSVLTGTLHLGDDNGRRANSLRNTRIDLRMTVRCAVSAHPGRTHLHAAATSSWFHDSVLTVPDTTSGDLLVLGVDTYTPQVAAEAVRRWLLSSVDVVAA